MVFPSVMNTIPSSRRASFTGGVCLLLLTGVAFAMASGCSKSEAATRPSTGESTTVIGGAKNETDTFIAEIKAPTDYKAGSEGALEVTLTPKGGYHTNAQYPYKFKLNDPAPDGVTYPKPVLQRADGTFEEKRGSFKVPFVARKPGKTKLGGLFHLSVCSDANCIMDKVALEVDVDVK